MTTADKGGLRFSTARTLKVDDLLKIYDGIIGDADSVLEESQIGGTHPVPLPPSGTESYLRWTSYKDPLPPEDLTAVPDIIIGKMFSYMQNWTNYVAAEVTRAKCIKDIQERHLKVLKAALGSYYAEEESVPATLVGRKVEVDQRYVEVDAAYLRIKVFYETARSREDQLKRTLNNISREQTRRRDELDRLAHDQHGGKTSRDPSPGGRPGARRPFRA